MTKNQGYNYILLIILYFSCSNFACAEEYRVAISQMKPDGSRIEVICSSGEKCKAVIPIVVEEEKSDLNIDFYLHDDGMNFQFLWKDKYLSVNNGSFLAVELKKDVSSVKEDAFLFVPLRADPYDTAAAVLRAGGKLHIADLEINVTRIPAKSR